MAYNTGIRPVNFGGGEIGTGIAMGLQQAGESLFQSLERKKQRQFEREQFLFKVAEKGLTPMDAIFNGNKIILNDIRSNFEEFIGQKTVDKKGIDNNVIMQVLTMKNLLNSSVNKIKQAEAYIAKQEQEYTKNQDKYDPIEHDKAIENYKNRVLAGEIVTMDELDRILVPREKDIFAWSDSQVINKGKPVKEDQIDDQRVKEIYTDDNSRIGRLSQGYWGDEGLRRNAIRIFNSETDKRAPSKEEKEKYMQKALIVKDSPTVQNKLFKNPEEYAPYLWALDDVAPRIQPDRVDIRWKAEKPKKEETKTIPENNNRWQMYDKPVKLTGYGGQKTTNVVELLYGQPRPDLSTGLYFKVYRTTGDEVSTEKAEGEAVTMQDLKSLFGGSDYEVDYIPYEDIAGMVEKQYKFEGVDSLKKRVGAERMKIVW